MSSWNDQIDPFARRMIQARRPFDKDEEREHFTQLEAAREAKDKARETELMQEGALRNQRLILKIGKRYAHLMQLDDILQEGTFGLYRAMQKFEVSRGLKFSTYASYWVRQTIRRAVQLLGAKHEIRLPVYIQDLILKIKREIRTLSARLQREPKDSEIIAWLVEHSEQTAIFWEQKLVTYHVYTSTTVYLDQPATEDSEKTLGESTPDPNPVDPSITRDSKRMLALALRIEALAERVVDDPRNFEIFSLRVGFTAEPLSLSEVGSRFDLTRERVRQIMVAAYRRLKLQHNISPEMVLAAAEVLRSRRPQR